MIIGHRVVGSNFRLLGIMSALFFFSTLRWHTKLKKRKSNAEIDYGEESSVGEQGVISGVEKSSSNTFSPPLMQDSDAATLSDLQIKPSSSLYIVLCSLHGLVRGQELELGRDSDTGGQVKYAIEHAKALAKQPNVVRVDLLTRMVCAPNIDADYGVEEEALSSNAFVTRLSCGDKVLGCISGAEFFLPFWHTSGGFNHTHKGDNFSRKEVVILVTLQTEYIAKESLWPHVREFADRGIMYVRKRLEELRMDIQRSQAISESDTEPNSATLQDYSSSDIQGLEGRRPLCGNLYKITRSDRVLLFGHHSSSTRPLR